MENFVVSARKYRPSTFDMVVGQQSITGTLKNAIVSNQLAHAFLFCGPRGVGKTTCARIFAKTINCQNRTPQGEACNECESCHAFNSSRSYNIHELDAASNNSVEDIRSLIDQVRIPPQIGTHSVYIIDEVHMLSTAAFNAFLKTLEEPPKHAIFVMATTEKHKILPTILSRCQIFDFNRIKLEDIAGQLAYVAKKENIEYEEEALHVIAQKADGGMRDALSYFDQISSFSDKKITYQSAIKNLNVLDYEYYFKLVEAFWQGNTSEALVIFNDILNHGFDAQHFIAGLNKHLRDLLVAVDEQTLELIEVTNNVKQRFAEQSKKIGINFLFHGLRITNQCDITFKNSQNQRLHVELALLNLCNLSPESPFSPLNPSSNKQTNTQVAKEQEEPKKKDKAPAKQVINSALNTTISAAINGNGKTLQKAKKEAKEKLESKETPFNQENLNSAWKILAEKLKASFPQLQNLIVSTSPVLKENFVIEIALSGDFQKNSIEKNRDRILKILVEELSNTKISFSYKITQAARSKRVYSTEDKYKYLLQKNAKLDDLRKKFNLDLD